MDDAVTAFFVIVLPLFFVIGLPVLAILLYRLSKLWYNYKMAELDIRKLEADSRLNQTRLLAGAPSWLDASNPADVDAWRRAQIEVVRSSLS